MKRCPRHPALLLSTWLWLVSSAPLHAQSGGGAFTLDPVTSDGGGGRACSSAGCAAPLFELQGTVGQPDAGVHGSGGATPVFQVFGGFWFAANPLTVPVTLAQISASRAGANLVDLRWQTAVEAGAVGFRLLPDNTGSNELANALPLLPAAGDSLRPREYRHSVPLTGNRFRLQVLNADGSTELQGPFEVDAGAIGRDAATDLRAPDWVATRAGLQALASSARTRGALRSAGLSGSGIGLRVRDSGLHRLSYSALEDAGATGFAQQPVASLALLLDGQPVPRRIVSTDALFGPGDHIEFLATFTPTLYSHDALIALRVDPAAVRDVADRVASPAPLATLVDSSAATWVRNQALAYSFSAPGDDPWYEARLLATSAPVQKEFALDLAQAVSPAAAAQLRVTVWGGTDFAGGGPDHHVELRLDGALLAEVRFDGVQAQTLTVDLPALSAGPHSLGLRLPADTGHAADVVLLDRVEIDLRQRLAGSGRLDYTPDPVPATDCGNGIDHVFAHGFEASGRSQNGSDPCPAQQVAGFGPAATVWRQLADGRVQQLQGAMADASGLRFALPADSAATTRVWMVATATDWLAPQIEALPDTSTLFSQASDYLVLSHALFVDALAPLLAAKQAQGLKPRVIDVATLYQHYSAGRRDPRALAAFIAEAQQRWNARYVLLVGADTFDYTGHLGGGSQSLVPTPYLALHPLVRFAPADQALADTDGDGLPDLALGRWPVHSVAELHQLQAKQATFASSTPVRHTLLIADRSGSDPSQNFAALGESTLTTLGESWTPARVYRDQLQVAAARAAVVAAINDGQSLVQYFGHSSPSRLSLDNLLSASEVQSVLTNPGRPTAVLQWGCWSGYHVDPGALSMAAAWLLGEQGAALSVGAATLTELAHDQAFAAAFNAALAGAPGEARFGDLLLTARRGLGADAALRDVVLGQQLFGDPALPVR